MSIKIITDSTSDILQNELENVVVVPLNVTFKDKQYRDSIDLTKDEFYELLLSSDDLPVSSLASPFAFEEEFEKAKENGDEVIVLPISSGLSGTYQSALIASDGYDNVSLIDTKLVSAALKLLVLRGLELIKEGKTRQEIVDILEEEKSLVHIYAVADTLKYLQKGGRISKGAAILGGMIKIKPIITLDQNGKLVAIGKARGSKAANKFLDSKIQEAGGIDFTKPYLTGYAGIDNTNLMNYIQDNQNLIADAPHPIGICQIGSAVGTHCGPGAISVTFFGKK